MHLSYIITIAAFTNFIHSQASDVPESYPAASATSPLSTDSTDGVASATPAMGSTPPNGASASKSPIWSDATSSPTVTAGTASMAYASSTQVQSAMTAMSTSMGAASGKRSSRTANATNTTAAAASTTSLGKTSVAGQIRGFADTAGILVLIGIFAGL